MAFTKVVGAGIHTLAQLQTHNIHSAGIITATTFVGNIGGNPTFSGDATFNGNVSIGGTLTYEDVKNVDSVGIVTAREGVFIPDTKELKIGNNVTSPDLKLYHDNNGDSYISNATGHLTIRNNTSGRIINLQPKSGENGVIARYHGASELYHAGSERFSTTGDGVKVTGTDSELLFNATRGTGHQWQWSTSGTNATGIELRDTTANQRAYIYHDQTGLGGAYHKFYANGDLNFEVFSTAVRIPNDNSRLQIGQSQDLQLYHDTNNSYILDNGTGDLIINGSKIRLQQSSQDKLQTTSSGVRIDTILNLYGDAGNPGRLRLQEGGAVSEIIGTRNSDANSDLQFKTERGDGTQVRAKINYSGDFVVPSNKVGIGTDNPGVPLQIDDGSPKIILKDTDNNSEIYLHNVGGAAVYSSNGDAVFQTPSTEIIRMSATGRVGIGSASPGRALTITNSEPRIRLQDSDSGGHSEIYTDNSNHLYLTADSSASAGGSRIVFQTDGANERARIDNNGNFTFYNSAAVWNTLQRATATHFIGLRIQETDGTQRMQLGVAGTSNHIVSGSAQHDVVLKSYANLLLATNQTERLRIDSNGRVGLGITNPGDYFSSYNRVVMGRTNDTGGMTIVSSPTSGGYIAFAKGTSGNQAYRGLISYAHSNDSMRFSTDADSPTLYLDNARRVGINTTIPENADSVQIFGTTTPLLTIKAGATGSDTNRRATLRLWTGGNKVYKLEADASDGGLKILDSTTPRFVIDSNGHALFSGLTTKNDTRNAAGITIKSSSGGGGISFNTYGANGSRNWRIRPDDMTGWGALEFAVSPTANSATDWPDHIDDCVLSLEPNKDVIVRNGKLGVKESAPFADLDIASTIEDSNGSLGNHGIRLHNSSATDEDVIPITAGFKTQQARVRAGIGFICKQVSGDDGSGGAIGFYTRNTADGNALYRTDERVRIHENGRVTIGDSDASVAGTYGLFHLYQASNDPYMVIQRGAGDTGIDLGGIVFRNNTNQQGMIKSYQANVNTANLHFYVNYLGNFADRFLMESTGTFAIQGNVTDEKLVLSGSTNPYIRFREGSTNKAYVQWNSGGWLQLNNQEDGSVLRIKDGLDFSKDGSTYYNVHHSDNSSDWGENYTNYFVGTSGASTSVKDTEKTRFYKVTIYGVRNYGGGNDVRIMRAGVHTDNGLHGMWVGSMDVKIKFRPSNCGNGANYSRVVHNFHSNTGSVTQGQGGGNIAKIRDYISCSESGALYVWLRGQLHYQITVNGRPATVASTDMNDYVTSMDSSIPPAGFDGEGRDAQNIYFGYQGQANAGRKANGVAGGLEVQGDLTATGNKPFRIPHPLVGLSTTKDLIHTAIEGPQVDLIYRGKTTLVAGISTVNIDTKAGMTEGTFATLNRDVQCFTTNETGWTNVKGSVTGNKLTITAQDSSCTDTISWMVVGERQDDNIKGSLLTDSDGHLILEQDKEPSQDTDNPGEFSSGTSQVDENGVDRTFTQPLSS